MAIRGIMKSLVALGCTVALVFCLSCSSTFVLADSSKVSTADILKAADASEIKVRVAEDLLMPEATGVKVFEEQSVSVDYSNASEGYVMVKTSRPGNIKMRIVKGEATYTYDLPSSKDYTSFILSEGAGDYEIQLFEQIEGDTYSILFKKHFSANIADEVSPFLYPNQFVNYDENTSAVRFSYAACDYAGVTSPEETRELLFRYVADNVEYDYDKAERVKSGYLPDVDDTLTSHKGICFDYTSLLAAMLRARGVPTMLITGYLSPDDIYHAWNASYINGNWVFMDATLDGEGREKSAYTDDKEY